jgi:hypothetical protein
VPRPFLSPCLRFKALGRVGECFDLDKINVIHHPLPVSVLPLR